MAFKSLTLGFKVMQMGELVATNFLPMQRQRRLNNFSIKSFSIVKPALHYFDSDPQFAALIESIIETEREAGNVYMVYQQGDYQVLTKFRR